jgi:tRNA (cytidine/uridine-2'-O-)-methyltransferase
MNLTTAASPLLEIALYQPEIPPNAGNIIRLAANSGCRLHLIGPLGFTLEERQLRRAGLDYHDLSEVVVHPDWQAFLATRRPGRLFAFSTKGNQLFTELAYQAGDCLLFGPESRGLPDAVRLASEVSGVLKLPMQRHNRSLNLSNAVAVAVYEAWRQLGFAGSGE